MSRFLARALATVRAEVAPIARPAPAPKPPTPGFGGFGDFGGRAENENALAPAWPDGVDYWLTHDAVKLAGILNVGGTFRWCPNGGLDVWREGGCYVGISADLAGRLRLARLLPEALTQLGRSIVL